MSIPDRTTFEQMYAGMPPWEIGRPQKAFVDVAEQITGSVLDVGCGTGETALYFAARRQRVTGIDFILEPIIRARQKADERNLSVKFLVMDALSLKDLPEVYDSVIDSGLYHVFGDEDRERYVAGLGGVMKPEGRLFLLCFSDAEPGDKGPRRISRQNIETDFACRWEIESLEPARFEVRPDAQEFDFSVGGPHAWFLIARRLG